MEKYELDFTDADVVEKVQKNLEILAKANEEKGLTGVEGIRKSCKMIKDFVDNIYGEGSAQDIFGDSNSFKKHMEMVDFVVDQIEEAQQEINTMTAKYSPDRLKR